MGRLNVINLQSEKMRKLSLAQSYLKDAVINLLPEKKNIILNSAYIHAFISKRFEN